MNRTIRVGQTMKVKLKHNKNTMEGCWDKENMGRPADGQEDPGKGQEKHWLIITTWKTWIGTTSQTWRGSFIEYQDNMDIQADIKTRTS